MRIALALLLTVIMPASSLGSYAGYEVVYDGRSVPEKAGTPMYLYIEQNLVRLFDSSGTMKF
jgi:hypothetical protein